MLLCSIFDKQKHLSQSEDYKGSNNIVLRTAQSDKIAEISKKLEAQVRKPGITKLVVFNDFKLYVFSFS